MSQPPDEERVERLMPFMREMESFTGIIQDEIVNELLKRPGAIEDLKKQLNKPEEEIMKRLNAAILGFVGAMIIAHFNDVNLTMNMLKMHSTITDDAIIEHIMKILKEEREGPQPSTE